MTPTIVRAKRFDKKKIKMFEGGLVWVWSTRSSVLDGWAGYWCMCTLIF